MKICKAPNCHKKCSKLWYCSMHHSRLKRHWDIDYVRKQKNCSIEWCLWKYEANWYCNKHYSRHLKHWDANHVDCVQWEWRLKHPLYATFCLMLQRCYDKNCKQYMNYWWRWISVCEEWKWKQNFQKFVHDMWEKPEWTSLDRIDNNWDYSKENCRRATRHQQNSNTRNNNKNVWVSYCRWNSAWLAKLIVNKKIVLSKYFKFESDAINARKEAEKMYWIRILNASSSYC